MINAVRICEIEDEILKIQREQEETEQCLSKRQREEKHSHEDVRDSLRRIAREFEACHYDRQLISLVEEKYRLLLNAERDCGDFVIELGKEQERLKLKCESDIEDLEQEKQILEVMPICT